MLGGAPVQHRECQEHESTLFVSLFKGGTEVKKFCTVHFTLKMFEKGFLLKMQNSVQGIRYVPGGVKSGFKHYNPEDAPPRLFHVKGKRNVRVREVNCKHPCNVKTKNIFFERCN